MPTFKTDAESLRDGAQRTPATFETRIDDMFAAFEARMLAELAAFEARQARNTLALATLIIATHGVSTGIIIAVLG